MNETSTVISVETKHDALSSGERGVKVSDRASLSESSHLTRSTNLRNEKKKLKELNGAGSMQRTAIRIRGDLIPGVENL